MPLLLDPESNETGTLFRLFNDFAGKSVVEVGCGDGRLTWRYAEKAGRVTAIDPDPVKFAKALAAEHHRQGNVTFLNLGLESFAAQHTEKFDIAILAWSL